MERKRLLIVDDDRMTRMLIPALLAERHWDIQQASDGAEAIDRLAQREFDVMVLDLMMPNVNGFQVLDHLRLKHPQLLKKTIVLSGLAGQKQALELSEKELFRIMRKPFRMRDLVNAILTCAGEEVAAG